MTTDTPRAQLRPREELLAMLDRMTKAGAPFAPIQWLSVMSEAAERIRADAQASDIGEGSLTKAEYWDQMQEVAKANGFDGCTDAIVRAQKAEAKVQKVRDLALTGSGMNIAIFSGDILAIVKD